MGDPRSRRFSHGRFRAPCTLKQIYIHGGLDLSSTELSRYFGMAYSFEVGGPNKTKKQMRGETQGFIVKDTPEPSSDPSTVPLWAFGILKPA